MQDLLPTIVMSQSGARQMTASSGINSATQSSQTALFGSLKAAANGEKPVFAAALLNTIQAAAAQQAAGIDGKAGGNNLPLAAPAADTGLLPVVPGSAELSASSDSAADQAMTLVPGLRPEIAGTTIAEGRHSSTDVAADILPVVVPSTTVSVPAAADLDNSQQTVNATRDVKPVVALQGPQMQARADSTALPEVMLARAQADLPVSTGDMSISSGAPTVRAAPTPSAASPSIVDSSPATKSDAVVNETDLLLTSRLRQSGQPQPAEMPGYRLATETLMNTNQLASNETQQALINRSPIVPTPGANDTLTSTQSTTPAQTSIMEAFGKPEWGQGMGRQVMWMVSQNISRAEIRLNPANLGPMEVRIEMENDQVSVVFTSRHADVREAVEQALPRLREMLEDKGLNLSDTDVSQQSFAEQQQEGFDQSDDNRIEFGSGLQKLDETGQDQEGSVHGSNGYTESDLNGEGLIDLYI